VGWCGDLILGEPILSKMTCIAVFGNHEIEVGEGDFIRAGGLYVIFLEY
jgi:hypothetical protein